MPTLLLQQIWANKQIIAEILGLACVGIIAWWFFIHNPKVIDNLELDKAELARQVTNSRQAVTLLGDIQTRKEIINHATFAKISTIRSAAIPRRAVIVRGGLL